MENDKKAKSKIEEKAEAKTPVKASVKSYQQGIESEKQEMSTYSKGFEAGVKSLQADIEKHSKYVKNAALKMREEGVKNIGEKVVKFRKEIEDQIKENREAVFHMADNIKYFLSEIDKKKKDFQSYAQGSFNDYINVFEGNVKYFISEIDKKKKDFQSYAQGSFNDYINAFWG